MRRLANKTINRLCDEIIKEINLAIDNNKMIYLCNSLAPKLKCGNKEIINFIPKFNYENAAKHANAYRPNEFHSYWWSYYYLGFNINEKNLKINQNKIIFMQWLKEQYPVTPKV